MGNIDISALKKVASDAGAPIFGVCQVSDLADNSEDIEKILPDAASVVVVAVPHSRSAISSENLQVAQFDTIFSYNEAGRISHVISRVIEERGHRAVSVPAFIPIDMSPPKMGMVGPVDWRKAAVCAGIGSYGESALLLTEQHGPAVRVGGVITSAKLPYGDRRKEELCTRCMSCIENCPPGALEGKGNVDKRKCGSTIFSGGYRAWRNFLLDLVEGTEEERKELLKGQMSLELWHNFMSGNYYYCFVCQAVCPVGKDEN